MWKKLSIGLFLLVAIAGIGYWSITNIKIEAITLVSPDNSAIKEDIQLSLNKKAAISVEYWKTGTGEKYKTPLTGIEKDHVVHLMLLEPNTSYSYKVVINGLIDINSKTFTFKTREPSPWMVHEWLKDKFPHDANALGDGLVMLCYRGFPGHISMVDGKGTIRWYWQDEEMGVRMATLTPRNTILALLAPASKDEFHKKKKEKPIDLKSYYLRTGKIGFVGGTQIAEINLEGKVLWRVDIDKQDIVFHHDLQMTKDHQIASIYRDYKMYDLEGSGVKKDTLWGDGVMVMDTLGKVVKKWSAWDHWDLSKDNRLKEYAGDRFHFNSLTFDDNGDYILSTPIENQVWKINAITGKIEWKLGENGDFKMNKDDLFYFQHDARIDPKGNLMLFDNGDYSPNDTTKVNKRSRVLSFDLNTEEMTADPKIKLVLPQKYYTSRMGGAALLPNNNIMATSSKTGGVLITDSKGEVLWVLNTHFIPYRAEYVPSGFWQNYIQ
ncbi:aryl-sulfate sulfotransferase [Flavobacteriaceae bacterium F89]|uniref:Aryl-sulfate sulfotransferase n=1 Tax=Cerina litoralis TaxID=2874477 RepID=A0AAE3EWB9_9FLAO|nr:aryl-sulfate sulfotransferase [Cerina litoralis]MCG2462282.1 aryl-sulfate sulfotransferase [Cerina litoralis]